MAYIGNEPVIGQWRKLDDISGSFNGSLTSFTTRVGGTNVTAGSANQLLVSLGGVLQEPGTDYSVSSSTITFTTAPAASLSFFAVLAGDALNTSVPADGSITTAKLGANLTVDLGLGSAGTPSLTFDADSGLFSGGDNQVAVSTSGVERVEFGASEVVFNDGGDNYDFRVEGDTEANLLFVDASTDCVGIGTSSPGSFNNDMNDLVVGTGSGSRGIGIFSGNASTGNVLFHDAANTSISGMVRYDHSSDAMSFWTNGTNQRLTIDSSGRLLVNQTGVLSNVTTQRIEATGDVVINSATTGSGQTASLNLYHLVSNSSATRSGGRISSVAEDTYTAGSSATSDSALTFSTTLNAVLGERLRIDSSGRLLVGTSTTSSSALLQVQGNSSNSGGDAIIQLRRGEINQDILNGESLGSIQFSNSQSTVSAVIEAVADANWNTTNDYPSRLVFSTTADGASSPTERMSLNSVGGLKVRSNGAANVSSLTNGAHELTTDFNGNEVLFVTNRNSTSPLGMQIFYPTDINNTANPFLTCFGSSTRRAEIRSNGGIANFQSNDANLCDEREKKNIESLDSTWGCLKNWEVKKFHYNEDSDTADKRYGVIAQQVAEHCPEVITDWVKQKAKDAVLDDDGNVVSSAQEEIVRMGVKEQQMYWMAIRALQEAQTRIETLEAEVAALKGA